MPRRTFDFAAYEAAELLRLSAGKCKYTKCSHTKEDGCDVLARVKDGSVEKTRHASYVSLYEILKKKPTWKK